MRIPRLLTIVGPAAVLYTLAARASSETSASPEWLVALLALAFSLSPLAVVGSSAARRASALGLMGVSLAVAIASSQAGSRGLERAHDMAWLVAALAMLDLALPRSVRSGTRAFALSGFAVAAVAAGVLADEGVLPGVSFAIVVVAGILGVGAVHQLVLTSRGHTVEGSLSAIAIVSLAVGLAYAWIGGLTGSLATVVESAAGLLLWLGHLAWVDPRWRSLRRAGVPVAAASAICFITALALWSDEPLQRWEVGLLAVGSGLLWWAVFSSVARLSQRSIWAASGRLADAAEAARRDLVGRTTIEDVASAALVPLGRVFSREGGAAELYSLEPPLCIRLETGERPSVRTAELSGAVVRALMQGSSREIIDVVKLRPRVVRDPGVREVVEALQARSAGAVVPCLHLDHLEGALVLPLDERSEPLTQFELEELGRLGASLGGSVCAALAQRRAESHIHELSELRRRAEDRVAMLAEKIAELREQCDVLGRAVAEDQTLYVAYSPSMRRVQTRAIELAVRNEPLLLVAGAGAPTLPVARFIHDRGPRWEAPFIVADCASTPRDAAADLLFGSGESRGGCFDSALGGTLLLRNLPALGRPEQARLARALGHVEPAPPDEVAPRIIATARRSLAELGREGALDPELARFLGGHCLVIPPLRDRREDVPSLALLAIDRACRLLGRDPVGIEQAAMSALVAHDWPGDVAELEIVIELAVVRTAGKAIRLSELPSFATRGEELGALSGTYSQVERRLLEHALKQAGGNKSGAARLLGLKRTTFLDKLRRHGLDERASANAGDAALG